RTADLDLSNKAGRAALDHRLVVASYEVCGTPSDADLVGKNKARECRADVLASARAQSGQLAARSAPIQIAARRWAVVQREGRLGSPGRRSCCSATEPTL